MTSIMRLDRSLTFVAVAPSSHANFLGVLLHPPIILAQIFARKEKSQPKQEDPQHSLASHRFESSNTLSLLALKRNATESNLHSISLKILTSSLVTKLIATPFRPNRPLRPIRWM